MLSSILGILLSGSVSRTVARTKRNSVFIAVGGLFIVTAYVFGLAAFSLWLSTIYGAIAAELILAAGALVLGAIILVVMAILNAQEAQRARERRVAMESAAGAAIGMLRGQPMLAVAIGGAFLLANLMGSSKND